MRITYNSMGGTVRILLLAICAVLCGCAADIGGIHTSFNFDASGATKEFTLAKEAIVSPGSYARTLKAGSKWRYVGKIPQGAVYEIVGDVFMLEAKHMHQAHCVLSNDFQLVGFYLPVEKKFIELRPLEKLFIQK
jgi:hypothetical protein